LSLPGRVTIAKTYLLSQLNYFGCIFSPTDEQLMSIQDAINSYIKKGLSISNERLYLRPESGGVGFFDIKNFLSAQKCSWIFRAKKLPVDNWRYDIHAMAPNNDPLLLRECDINRDVNLVLHGIVTAYSNFYSHFSGKGSNLKNAIIFDNQNFTDLGTGTRLSINFFRLDFYNQFKSNLRKLTYSDCMFNNTFKTMEEFANEGIVFTQALWFRLRGVIMQKKRLIDSTSDTHIEGINNIFRKWKRGSKTFRKYLDKKINPIEGNSFRKFKELVMVDPDPDETWMRNWFSSWNTHSFNNDFRFFIFKLRYNYIGTNNRLNAYLKDVDPRCTYCRMLDRDSNQRDSLLHCFL
jgi:hypothetical protein